MCCCVQRDRLVKEFIVPLEKRISSEQEEKQVVQNERQEWCNNMRMSYKSIKEGRSPLLKLSKANIKLLENAGFEWCLK
jgi:hypothetical protein